eukprot:scaffold12957_cov92-Isochrysis_galbana.AAC.2
MMSASLCCDSRPSELVALVASALPSMLGSVVTKSSKYTGKISMGGAADMCRTERPKRNLEGLLRQTKIGSHRGCTPPRTKRRANGAPAYRSGGGVFPCTVSWIAYDPYRHRLHQRQLCLISLALACLSLSQPPTPARTYSSTPFAPSQETEAHCRPSPVPHFFFRPNKEKTLRGLGAAAARAGSPPAGGSVPRVFLFSYSAIDMRTTLTGGFVRPPPADLPSFRWGTDGGVRPAAPDAAGGAEAPLADSPAAACPDPASSGVTPSACGAPVPPGAESSHHSS